MDVLPKTPLPKRPRLLAGLPVLGRRPGEVQIGLDPRHGVVASGLPPHAADALRRLDGSTPTDALLAAAPEEADALHDLLTGLAERGLLEDAAERPELPPGQLRHDATAAALRTRAAGAARRPASALIAARAGSAVRIIGNGRLAIAIGTSLAAAGVGRVRLDATGTVGPEDIGCGYTAADIGRRRRHAAAGAIRAAAPDPVHRLPRTAAEFVVLADAPVPDPALVYALQTRRIPHLLVHARGGRGIVGPLVFPGRTSCLRCADLHRAGADPSWAAVAGQLAGRALPTELACAQATAAFAVGQVLTVLERTAGSTPATWNGTVEVDPFDCAVRRVGWPPHGGCDCRDRKLTGK